MPRSNGKKVFDGDLISILDSKEFLYILHWDDIKKDYILACTSLRVSNCDLSILNRPEDVEVVGNIYEEEKNMIACDLCAKEKVACHHAQIKRGEFRCRKGHKLWLESE